MPRGVKGSGKAAKSKRVKREGLAPSAALEGDDLPFQDDANDGLPRCRLDGTPLEAGRCPSCARRAQRFAELAKLEARVLVCESCGAPMRRKHGSGGRAKACNVCKPLLAREKRLKARLEKAA